MQRKKDFESKICLYNTRLKVSVLVTQTLRMNLATGFTNPERNMGFKVQTLLGYGKVMV